VGVGVARKVVDGEAVAGPLVVTFFVRRKIARRYLAPRERIPARLWLEAVGRRVETDVVAVGDAPRAQAGSRVRPLRAGAEVSHVRGLPGTLALLVRRKDDPGGAVLGLSCSHVVACSGVGVQAGDPVEQPFAEGDAPGEVVGILEGFTRLRAYNVEDVGLFRVEVDWAAGFVQGRAQPTAAASWRAEDFPPDTPTALLGSTSASPRPGSVLARTTTWTVTGLPFFRGDAVFEGVVAYRTACRAGDSGGAVLLGGRRTVIGMHLAGIPELELGLLQPIAPILARHGLTLVD
jgi:hypothetical protein